MKHSRNIDRIFAIWQELNPKTWDWHQPLLDTATFVSPLGTDENPESPLVPFRKWREGDEITWWTSEDVRDCRSLGYSYPELTRSGTDIRSLRQWVTDSYEWATIYGEPPPWKTLSETMGTLEKIEALPSTIRIDDRGEPVEKADKVEYEDVSFSKRISKIFHRNGSTNDSSYERDRYSHIKPLLKSGWLMQWNVTIKVEKYGSQTFTPKSIQTDVDSDSLCPAPSKFSSSWAKKPHPTIHRFGLTPATWSASTESSPPVTPSTAPTVGTRQIVVWWIPT